jgi:hypothetical protein
LGELIAKAKRRQTLSDHERFLEDEESREMIESYQAIVETLDPLQKQIITQKMMDFLPSEQVQFMQKLVEGDIDDILPPTQDEVKQWKSIYLCYFNSDKSIAEGRRMPLSMCVKNPRPDEITEALR